MFNQNGPRCSKQPCSHNILALSKTWLVNHENLNSVEAESVDRCTALPKPFYSIQAKLTHKACMLTDTTSQRAY